MSHLNQSSITFKNSLAFQHTRAFGCHLKRKIRIKVAISHKSVGTRKKPRIEEKYLVWAYWASWAVFPSHLVMLPWLQIPNLLSYKIPNSISCISPNNLFDWSGTNFNFSFFFNFSGKQEIYHSIVITTLSSTWYWWNGLHMHEGFCETDIVYAVCIMSKRITKQLETKAEPVNISLPFSG